MKRPVKRLTVSNPFLVDGFHMRALILSSCVAAALAAVSLTCTTLKYDQAPAGYQKQILQLEDKLRSRPDDPEILRDLGVLYFQTREFLKAEEKLKKSVGIDGKDPKALLYYGLTLESEDKIQPALATYINYSDFSALSQYRRLMEGRYRALERTVIKEQFKTLLAQEEKLGEQPLPSTALAVFPLQCQTSDPKYASLGLGLSEMITIDLGQVRELKLVERLRIEELMNELSFGQSSAVDPSTAPRLGHLLTAGRLISGSYDVSRDEKLRLDVSSFDVTKKDFREPTTKSDQLSNLFKIQKDLVFAIITDLGITLTREEEEKIQKIPTKNLQAFMMYCNGLDNERRGDYKGAEAMFKEAVRLDPGFEGAKSRAEAAGSLSAAGGTLVNAVVAVEQVDKVASTPVVSTPDLIINRLQNLGNGIGTTFTPGQDSRKAPEEALAPRALPRPPDPPKP